ncbi:hypothetical protein [[Phormidium] sp. ETS-05]|uniref:hypothetical protein n=1 Tax=[Phormidium] sp. ETS-05 TaxID=222819 RepID=UPI0018EEFF0B|nr:hypothetical protein [[Phormidium] sp. ETS-05]
MVTPPQRYSDGDRILITAITMKADGERLLHHFPAKSGAKFSIFWISTPDNSRFLTDYDLTSPQTHSPRRFLRL